MRTRRTRPPRVAFSLVEVVLAIAVVSFALVTLLGVMVPGLRSNRVSADEINATTLASLLLSDLRSSPAQDAQGRPLTASARYGLPLPAAVTQASTNVLPLLADGSVAPASASGSAYKATVAYVPSGQYGTPPGNRPALVSLVLTWPASASAGAVQGTWQGVASFPQAQAQWK